MPELANAENFAEAAYRFLSPTLDDIAEDGTAGDTPASTFQSPLGMSNLTGIPGERVKLKKTDKSRPEQCAGKKEILGV
jgi:hypothetical protein